MDVNETNERGNIAEKVYGGTGIDRFYEVVTDTNNDIICVGYTASEDSNCWYALVVKFSGSDLSILARKVYGGTGTEYFHGVTTDTNNDIICAGITGSDDALVVKFSGTDLSILSSKVYGGSGDDCFNGVTTDSNNDTVCVGYTSSDGDDALVVKFSGNDPT